MKLEKNTSVESVGGVWTRAHGSWWLFGLQIKQTLSSSFPVIIPLLPSILLWHHQQLWCHHCPHDRCSDVITSVDSQTQWRPAPKTLHPRSLFPPRPSALRANCVSLFCQQSFLKEIFFQRNCYCLILYGCVGTRCLSLSLAVSLSSCLSLCLPAL